MDYALYLIASGSNDAETLAALRALVARKPPAAVLVPKGERTASAYARLVLEAIAIAQPSGCAVLLDNEPDRVAELRADGVHITGGIAALRAAIDALKPDFIVGAGDIGSRHEAMLRGELDIDYLMFGDRDGESDGAEMAAWWAETFEIPSVYCAQGAADPAIATTQSEFVAFLAPDWPRIESDAAMGAA